MKAALKWLFCWQTMMTILAATLVALFAVSILKNVDERRQLYTTLQERELTQRDSREAATRRIDLLQRRLEEQQLLIADLIAADGEEEQEAAVARAVSRVDARIKRDSSQPLP